MAIGSLGSNRRFLLRIRPVGRIADDTFELVEEPILEIQAGEALVRTQWISLHPTNRIWIRDTELSSARRDRRGHACARTQSN
jgi:NADPH-dependent curcumin reductase CurA